MCTCNGKQQLGAANQHIEELQRAVDVADQAMTYFKTGKDAAERKLTDIRQALVNIQNVARDHAGTTWDGIRSLCKHALAQIEQPREGIGGEVIYQLDRYRNGVRMAEGARVRARNEEEAKAKAAKLFYESGDEFQPWYPETFVVRDQQPRSGSK